MMTVWNVRVRLVDRAGNKVAESSVDCQALDPGAACVSAYVVARAEVKTAFERSKRSLPNIHAVHFIVLAGKRSKK